ncbi:MAG: S8 family serine peptidase [Caldilineales bacterium]|nr:S8 family serine peptidase [Caldilineales bacterium]
MKHRTIQLFTAASLVIIFAILALGPASAAPESPHIDPAVFTELSSSGASIVMIVLDDGVDLTPAYAIHDKAERGAWVYETLRAQAMRSQAAVIQELDRAGLPHRQFWIVNAVQTTVTAESLKRLSAIPGVKSIVADSPMKLLPPEEIDVNAASVDLSPWGVWRVEAPWAWGQGITGKGVIVAGQDTGYAWEHPALYRSFRGYNAGDDTAEFDYNWHDSIHEPVRASSANNICGYNSPTPCDDHYHGTHTMGTILGNDMDPENPAWPAGAANAVGVAPGAEWIACRNMDQGVGRPSTYIECFEWFVAPYPVGGDPLTEGDPAKSPDVINNSWACPPSEGCTSDKLDVMEPAVDAADAAGIVVVVSAGNEGPGCGSVVNPPALYPRSFAVGATNSTDALASFSSLGPASYQGVEYAKPDVSAPGVSVRSSIPGDGYVNLSGTSMAAPHTVGVIALLLEADPTLRGDTERIKAIISATADPVLDFQCGADTDGSPNNRFGSGIVNIRRAIESLQQQGFISGTVSNWMGRPLKGSLVEAYADGALVANATANTLGSYNLTLDPGVYDLKVIRFGYVNATAEDVQVVGGQTTNVNFELASLREYLPVILR